MLTTNVVLKSLTALLLTLPVGGYAVGSLAASSADDDTPRQTIQLEQAGPTSDAQAVAERHQRPARHHRPTSKAARPAGVEAPDASTDGSDDDVDDQSPDATGSGQVETIVPRYHESGESEGPDVDEATTTATDDDARGDDGGSGESGGDHRGDGPGDDSDQDGGGD